MPARFQYDVFLSHRGAQKDWTENLARRLRDDGFKVWFDKWELDKNPGQDWIDALRAGVEASRKVALVLSPEFFAGDWPVFESRIIQLLDPIGRQGRIIPILHSSYTIPADLSFRHALDFTQAPLGTIDFEFSYHKLVHALDPSRPYEGDSKRFKTLHAGQEDLNLIPTVGLLPRGSRMPHASNPLFVGRENEMRDLARMLAPGSGATVGVYAAVQGMGGVGKTQLAIEYAFRYGNRYPGGIFWLNFAKEEEIIIEVAVCGGHEAESIPNWNAMKPPDQAAIVQRLWHESGQPRLLIFDNAEDPALVEKWRPKHGRCSILITCRRDEWPAQMGVKPLPIETLPRDKSLELLAEARPGINTNPKDRETADKICELLGDLPLALTVAAAYLRRYKNDTLAEYLEALSSQPLEKELSASFSVSFNKLDPHNPTDALAQKLFYLASFFAPVSINRALLAASAGLDYSKKEERHQADDALARLKELGLIKEEPDGRLLEHRLLREFALQNRAQNLDFKSALNAVSETVNSFAVDQLHIGLPQALACERPHLRHIASQAEKHAPDLAPWLYNSLGTNGHAIGLLREAKADCQKATELAEVLHGSDHPALAICLSNLAGVLLEWRDLIGARAHMERALSIEQAIFGSNNPNLAIRLNNLGEIFRQTGDLAGARVHFERALEIDKMAYGEEHRSVASDLGNLGVVLTDLGYLEKARSYLERALDITEAACGPNHPDVAIRLNNLGSLLRDLGDLEGSRILLERALNIEEAIYGPTHPNVSIIVNNLGLTLKEMGDLVGARTNYDRALKIDEAVHGANHPAAATRLNNLAAVLNALGDLNGACATYERALGILKQTLGDDHPSTRTVQHNLDVLNNKR